MKLAIKGQKCIILIPLFILALLIPATFAISDSNFNLITKSNAMNVSPGNAYGLMHNRSGPVIIDLRTPQEFKSGHLEGAINMDYYSNGFACNLAPLDKNITNIIYCRKGIRGGLALKIMNDLGFKEVYNIAGGLTLWAQEGRPMIGVVI